MPPPTSTTTRWCLLLRGDRRRPGVVRRSQAGGLASSIVDACASLLKASLFNLCLYSDIVASADSLVYRAFVFEPSRPLACNMKLVFF